jgi:hypothetical protein
MQRAKRQLPRQDLRNSIVVPLRSDETPPSNVPDDVLYYLMPSRYCESDILSRAAQQLPVNSPKGLVSGQGH